MKTVKAAPKPFIETVETFPCEQGSTEWFQMRLGIPTASVFHTVLATGKDGGKSVTRYDLLCQLAGEILSGQPAETYSNAAMERGKTMEAEARDKYAFERSIELDRIGFVLRTLAGRRVVGASPDSFIGYDGVLEVKTMLPKLMVRLRESGGGPPPEHKAQCQGALWVTGRQWCDLRIYYRGMPWSLTYRLIRDEPYIRALAEAVEVFQWELSKIVERNRNGA